MTKWMNTWKKFQHAYDGCNNHTGETEMNENLIKKTYEHFNGVWPDNDYFFALTTGSRWSGDAESKGSFNMAKVDSRGFLCTKNKCKSGYLVPYIDENSWVIACTRDEFNKYHYLDKLSKQWLPEVGQECEIRVNVLSDFMTVSIQAFSHDMEVVFVKEGEDYNYFYVANIKFRPLKTERDKFIEQCIELKKAHMWTEEEFVGAIFDKGARFND